MQRASFSIIFDNTYGRVKSEKVQNLSQTLGLEFQDLTSELNIPRFWSVTDATDIEIRKAVLRSELRYSSTGIKLSSALASAVIEKIGNRQESKFHTLLYPIIHLPGDKAEEGGFHTDQIDRIKLRTGWVSITHYKYIPLRFIPFGLLGEALSRRLLRHPIKTVTGVPIRAVKGEVLTWRGGFYHRGNLNTSTEISCAVVIRITDTPLFLEPTRRTQLNDHSFVALTSGGVANQPTELNQLVQTM